MYLKLKKIKKSWISSNPYKCINNNTLMPSYTTLLTLKNKKLQLSQEHFKLERVKRFGFQGKPFGVQRVNSLNPLGVKSMLNSGLCPHLCPHIISIGFYPPLGDNTNKAGLSPALLKANRNNSHPPFGGDKTLRVWGGRMAVGQTNAFSISGSEGKLDRKVWDLNLKEYKTMEYSLETFNRSNQDTCLVHRPAVFEGQWVQSGDLLADCASSVGGELALGQNLLIAYMPWEGYNYEDAILISERLVYDDLYTSVHIEKYEIETRETKLGNEEITRNVPDVSPHELSHLDKNGIVKVGSWVEEGDILVGKITPIPKKVQSPYQKLVYTILEKDFLTVRDSSLRAPKGIRAKIIKIQLFKSYLKEMTYARRPKGGKNKKTTALSKGTPSPKNHLNQNKPLKIKAGFKNSKLLLTPGEGKKANSNLTSKKLKKYFKIPFLLKTNSFILLSAKKRIKINNNLTNIVTKNHKNLGLLSSIDSLLFSYESKKSSKSSSSALNNKLALSLLGKKQVKKSNTVKKAKKMVLKEKTKKSLFSSGLQIHLYLAEKRKVQVGDKLAGRHGNKGIISMILPREDMPYLPDGTPIDMVLNPLGVPSRMNVGQIYECLLGFAGKFLGENYKVFPFDEIYGPEASRSFVYSKLNQARLKTGSNWIFNPATPGKLRLYDGRTGDCFDQAITVGQAYILRLVHMVDDKIHARSTGPYSLVTQQPLRGRSKQGGQRLGEMEVWALEGYGAAFTLLEMLTIKSDDMTGRMTLWSNLILNSEISIGTPESFKVLICELQALCLDIGLFRFNNTNFSASNYNKERTSYLLAPVENLMNLK
jgi:DNA-directed RNA polymerase subunit beta